MSNTRRLTKKEMRIFAVGQLGWSILGGIINTWLVTFYLPTKDSVAAGAKFYVPTGLIILGVLTILGLITFICRLFDAVTDPWIASLSDRSKNPKGRRIPFMRIAAVPFAVITVLVFCAPVQTISTINIIWVLVFLILFYLFMTMYCTPYNALISEFGKTQEDRMYISTAISLTFFFGTLIAYIPFVLAGPLQGLVGYGWSYRIWFIVLAIVALICMLIPTFKLNEKDFVDAKPSESNAIKSLAATFKNKDFLKFSTSDIAYWIGLTLFQTGLPFFVKVSMHLDELYTIHGSHDCSFSMFLSVRIKTCSQIRQEETRYHRFSGAGSGICIYSTYRYPAASGYCIWRNYRCYRRIPDGSARHHSSVNRS